MTTPYDDHEIIEADEIEPLVPEFGFAASDFPSMAVAFVPYNANPGIRPDPMLTINEDGWLFIEVGNVRLAVPDREEWTKLIWMGERLWNTHERTIAANLQLLADSAENLPATMSDSGGNTCKENTHGSTDHPNKRGPGQSPGDHLTDPRGDGAAPPSVQA